MENENKNPSQSNFKDRLLEVLDKYKDLGEITFPNGTHSIGKIPGKDKWFLIHLYGGLNSSQIQEMESSLGLAIPNSLKCFFSTFNGVSLFGAGQLAIWGHIGPARQDMPNYQPISFVNGNRDELGKAPNLLPGTVFIGGYFGCTYQFYITPTSDSVYVCKMPNLTPVEQWNNIEDMLVDVAARLSKWFDSSARPIDPVVNEKPVLFEHS